MPRPLSPQTTFSRIDIQATHFADLEHARRQSRTRSGSAALAALLRWVSTDPDASARFARWCDDQASPLSR